MALGVVALFTAYPPPVQADKTGSQHNLENHQYKDSRKCLLTAAALGCGGGGGKRTVVIKRHVDKRQRVSSGGGGGGGGGGVGGGGGGGGGGSAGDRENDLDQNANSFDYNYDGGGGDGGGGGSDGGEPDAGSETSDEYYEPPLITDPRDRMLPVIYNPRPMYVATQQQQQTPFTRYTDENNVPPINPYEVPIIGEWLTNAYN